MPSYEIVEGYQNMDLIAVHAFLKQSYWSPEIPFEVVRKAAENSICFGIKVGGEQVAFARVITDKATFAYLSDVYVLEEHRGRGLSHQIMERITQHADLQHLRRFMLVTRDAHSLYSRYGFEVASSPERIMEVLKPDLYRTEPS
ncbi:MAG: GNAT family N-acetyltransferase [Planctomyces sp.]|nr:GNAT family N-acetyltransferase [Planctomyces sp.]